jgi:hypothetical protein
MWPTSPGLRPNSRQALDLKHPLLDPNAGDISLSPRKSSPSNSEKSAGRAPTSKAMRKADRSNEVRVISREELAEMMRNRDPGALEELGGVEGIASSIQRTLSLELADLGLTDDSDFKRNEFDDRMKRALSASNPLSMGLNLQPRSAELRRERFGANRVTQKAGQHAGIFPLFIEALQDDTSVLILAFAIVSVVLGMVECQPSYFDPDPGLGNINGDSCPPRPLWAGNLPIDLPLAHGDPDSGGGGGGGNGYTWIPCLAWAEGLAAAAAVCLAALARAACERWRQRAACRALDWERAQAQATVVRGGVERRIPAEDILVARPGPPR